MSISTAEPRRAASSKGSSQVTPDQPRASSIAPDRAHDRQGLGKRNKGNFFNEKDGPSKKKGRRLDWELDLIEIKI